MNARDRIALAWAALREIDPGYLAATLAQRVELSGGSAGSVYEGVDASELERKLLAADWEPYSHPAVMPDCTAFKAALPGRLGVVVYNGLGKLDSALMNKMRYHEQILSTVEHYAYNIEPPSKSQDCVGGDERKQNLR